jgi:hypothetical protein
VTARVESEAEKRLVSVYRIGEGADSTG